MFLWLKKWFGNISCGICYKKFKSKLPDVIVMEYSTGKTERIEICPICAGELELIKRNNSEIPYRIDYDGGSS